MSRRAIEAWIYKQKMDFSLLLSKKKNEIYLKSYHTCIVMNGILIL